MPDPAGVDEDRRHDADRAPELRFPARPRRPSPRRRRRVLFVLAGAAAVVLLVSLARPDAAPPGSSPRTGAQPVTEYPPAERGEAVTIEGRDLRGQAIDTASLRGRPLVINVWGSWCAPCRTEAPVLRAVSAGYASRGVQFLGLNVKDNPAAAIAFERRFQISYPSLDDQSGQASLALARYLPASVVPATLVLDAQGRVSARVLGAVEASTLRALLDSVTSTS